MNSERPIKTKWSWEEWQASRAARKAISDKIGSSIVRRKESSSDRRLHEAFDKERGPAFKKSFEAKMVP